MTFHVIIPARYQSTRLFAKPLAEIGDKPMILHVCESARLSGAKSVTVATDHVEIKTIVQNAGYDAVMTREEHATGSDRIFEAAELLSLNDKDIIVNVQGDEPFIPSRIISQVANVVATNHTANSRDRMATLCCPIRDINELENPNIVKVIFDKNKKAIYFSRSVIPYDRDKPSMFRPRIYFRHIGIYAYTKVFLKQFVKWPVSHLEEIEKLEQLRVIENGKCIYLDVLEQAPPAGIDTPEDLEAANLNLNKI